MNVEEAMSRRVVTCRPTEGMNEVARKMWDEDLGCILVTDASMRPLGVVTDRDLCMGAYMRGRPLADIEASACMQTQVQTCHPDEALIDVIQRLGRLTLRRLPVVDEGGRLLGMLSLGDAARAAEGIKTARNKSDLLQGVASALAAITRPRHAEAVVEIVPATSRKAAKSATKKKAKKSSRGKR